ncbi:exodeoxyribonuclease VII large subunit [Clostridium tetanomorphum]|uniref:Exodeoxyribonuclease 7 large subunit n=1 Tax=Clostridium tetanomorphum TaxID=1553 RepID=A0A923E527_CLOTT|nr:exodeoxyribonuclease VII large subunit [Clostridium tetanomorphum]KAJ51477.1 exodeoxyribonuclease VII large subunit [Clostridium tetanomorphum DSM 665]MBC2396570.1 exodeoxyribonuclease VII large subunit [Clostridium tetanomorphum]MBP1863898.1 exodeoxyribonuclease VII large subunit [Clostridium tetanomorphum]NRS84976.1 exodeoxyribonuclease VII large subunit [Clostridium tetanomorphum]NRZ98192.1 exodeoxyribonuclease VII large subunit [Clostridium tetanomorphum]
MYIKTLTVSDVNNYIKKVIDNDFILNNASVSGEISNFKLHSSGHIYFSLKDSFSKINCVMFRSYANSLKFTPENGMKVIVKGKVSLYSKEGVYQLYCEDIQPEGLGELYVSFEKLKKKLEEEGLFDSKYKKDIPKYVRKIGIVTSPTGAAIRDIINVVKRRNNKCEILVYPAAVQGIDASEEIIKGIEELNRRKDIDIIIIARGGGSIEELWAFNDEKLGRTIFNSKIPIITGVGHEIDYTIVDFVSDRRAPTPSAAAEIAVFDLEQLETMIENYKKDLQINALNNIKERINQVNLLKKTLNLNSPSKNIVNEYNRIDTFKDTLNYKIKREVDMQKEKLNNMKSLLSAHNPLNILNKGYAIIQDEKNNIINSIDKLNETKSIKIKLKDGENNFNIVKS